MTTILNPQVTKALRRAAVRATKAPSLHNTQPWRFVITADSVEIHAERSRRLRLLDPLGRQLMLSCGCALLNARAALAASGFRAEIARLADPTRPELVARIRVGESLDPEDADEAMLARLDPAIDERRTNRRPFWDEAVPHSLVAALKADANLEGADLFPIVSPEHRSATVRLSQLADDVEGVGAAYRAESRAWTTGDQRCGVGVPARVNECLLLLGTPEADPMAWLRAGEALERILLEIVTHGYAVNLFTQVIEVARTNELLRRELGLRMHPYVLLSIGRAPATPSTRRRRLADVISEG